MAIQFIKVRFIGKLAQISTFGCSEIIKLDHHISTSLYLIDFMRYSTSTVLAL